MEFPPPTSERDRAIVLVHGAWVGEWSWLPVMPLLRASGRPVFAVSLTGHGAARHHGGSHVNLSTHVADVVGLIKTLDLTNVTLVGHSYGGRVITMVEGEIGKRVAGMVYLDAHAPLADDVGIAPSRLATAEANGGMLPFETYFPDPALVGGPEGVTWFMDRVADQSIRCLTDEWMRALPDEVAKTYVFAANGETDRFEGYSEAAKAHPSWQQHSLDGSHFLMMSNPAEVAEIILNT